MLIQKLKVRRQVGAMVLPAILISFLVFLSFTKFFVAHNYQLSIGITMDLVFSIPLIHLLIARQQTYVKYSTALFLTAGILISGLIIPKNDQLFLREIRLWVVPAIEFCGIVFFVIKTRKILARFNRVEKSKGDFYDVLKGVTTELLPKRLASIITAEISAFYYAFFSWRKPVGINTRFTYHKKTGIVAFIGVFIFMILVETSVFHLLLAKWNPKIAWWFSGLSLYAALQALGIARSITKRQIQIIEGQLIIPYGILAQTTLNLCDILSIKTYERQAAFNGDLKCLSPFKKIEAPDTIIELAKPYYIEGIYGSKKKFDLLLINVDEKDLFIGRVQRSLNSLADPANELAESK
jgi:hypothetical protein